MAPRRYYPGFFGALFLVLLRVAIGWHIYYEGRDKIESLQSDQPFSSESYLRNATGPFADEFRHLVPDVDSTEILDREILKARWEDELRRVADHYQFDDEQRAKAQAALDAALETADHWFNDPENEAKVSDYQEDLIKIRSDDVERLDIAFENERLAKARGEIETLRREIAGPIERWTLDLRANWIALAENDQLETAGTYTPPLTKLDQIDLLTMYGLAGFGLCLMAGFLTPLAALGAAGLLFLFFISMPPLPGLPPNPKAEGTYLFVNKTLIESIALLALAATPSGLWFGVDRLLFGWIGRRGAAADPADGPRAGSRPGRAIELD